MRYQPSSLGSFWVSADGYELQMKGNSQNSRSYANFEAVAAFALLARALASALASALALGLACSLANLSRTYHKNKSKQSRAHAATPTSTAAALLEAYTTPGRAEARRAHEDVAAAAVAVATIAAAAAAVLLLLLLPLYSIQIPTASALASIFALWQRCSALRCSAPFALARRPLDWRCSVSQVQTVDVYGLWSGSAHIVTRVSEKLSRLQSGQEQQQQQQ